MENSADITTAKIFLDDGGISIMCDRIKHKSLFHSFVFLMSGGEIVWEFSVRLPKYSDFVSVVNETNCVAKSFQVFHLSPW